MALLLEADIYYLENKYHLTHLPFDGLRRFDFRGLPHDPGSGLDDAQIREGLEALYAQTKRLPRAVAKARAFAFVLEHTRISVSAHDFYVGIDQWRRALSPIFIERWREQEMNGDSPLHTLRRQLGEAGALFSGPDYDHVIPNWDILLELGFAGLLDRIRQHRSAHQAAGRAEVDAFFEGMEIEYQAVLGLIDRLRRYADSHPSDKSQAISACLAQLQTGAPRDTYEALQCMYLFFMLCEGVDNHQCRSLGNGFDQSLYRFYRADLESGRHSREELKRRIAYFLMQFSAMGSYWGQPLYIGGTARDGSTLVNELSYDMLAIYGELRLYNPKIQVKLNDTTPLDFVNRILELIRSGVSSFVFCCEPGFRKAVLSYGATWEEAWDFEISGCYETRVKYEETSAIVGWLNDMKAVELALNNGVDPVSGHCIGLPTGKAEAMASFDAFYEAFVKQLLFLIDKQIEISNRLYDPVLGDINPSLMYSGTNLAALEKGIDGYAYANRFNHSVIEHCGIGSTVDALMAVKEFVYDKGIVSLARLREILRNNWEGHEMLRLQILKSKCKYGNHHPVADQYAADIARLFSQNVNGKPNARGGTFLAELHSARQFLTHGARTAATPDGRRRGEELSKNASPAPGMDRCGVTALVHSALALKPYEHAEGFCLDVMLHPTTVAGEQGLAVMRSLLDVYMKGGGMAIHFNIFDTQTLLEAQKHPEKYENLQVRVCGWNTLWKNMSKAEQDAYILRSENIQA